MTEVTTTADGGLARRRPEVPARPAVLPRLRWVIAAVMLVSVIAGFFDRISVAVLFTDPGFNAAMGTGFRPVALGLLMSAFLFAYALSALLLSFVGDVLGPRRALGYAAGLWGVMMVLMGACGSYAGMIACRVVLGISEGPQFSLVSKTVRRWFPSHERARANALWMIGSPIGSAIGFPLTIWLVARFGWRASFYVFGALSIAVVMPLVFLVVRDRPPQMPGRIAEAAPARVPLKLADVRTVLADARVWMLSAYGAGLLTYLWGLNGWLPTYLQRVRHFDVHNMGIYSSLPFVVTLLTELTAATLSDRMGRRAAFSIVGLLAAGILLFVATRVEDAHVAAVVIALSAGAWGFGIPTQYALALKVLPAEATATGIGVINGIGNLVGACAPALIGGIVAATGSYQTGLLVIVVASVLGAAALLPMTRSY